MDGMDFRKMHTMYDMYTSMKSSLDKFPELVNSLGEATVSSAGAFAEVDEQLQNGFKSAQ